jgi:hypothetical protein
LILGRLASRADAPVFDGRRFDGRMDQQVRRPSVRGAPHNDLPFRSRIPFDRCVTTQRQALVRSAQRP